jgi:ATP-binding protein involved in chromosome partitioning
MISPDLFSCHSKLIASRDDGGEYSQAILSVKPGVCMRDDVLSLLRAVKNPHSGKSFTEENRWKDVKTSPEGKVTVVYARDGLSPQDKRLLEKTMAEFLAPLVAESNLSLMSVSDSSNDVFKAVDHAPTPAAVPAQIKTGHATPQAKKAVPGVGKVIAIGSGKGGVGKSTFTVNLAVTLSRMGKRVGVIDADIYGPSLPMLLGKRGEKPMASSEKKILPVESHGLRFMSFGFFVEEGDPVIWRGPMLGGVLNQFLFDTDWSGTDYLLIDLPPGTGDVQLSMVQNAHVDGAISISTPQDVALLDATKGLEMFRKLNLPIIGMVENMSSFICSNCNQEHFLFGEGGVEKAVQKLSVPFLGKIPLELELRQSADAGTPYMANAGFEARPVFSAFQRVARNVHEFFHPGDSAITPEKSGLFSRIFGR